MRTSLRRLGAIAGLGAILGGTALVGASPAAAVPADLVINPGGGVLADGSDGVKITIAGQDQVGFANTVQWCCSAAAPMLNIGGTLYGTAGPAYGSPGWTSMTVDTLTGSASTSGGTTAGSGGAAIHYSVLHGGRTYVMDRVITYTFPERTYRENYTFTIPAGNTDTVKFYYGGDAAPGSSDIGISEMSTTPVRSIAEINPVSEFKFGFREVASSKPFDGALAGGFYAPYGTVTSGGDIGFGADTNMHDAGLMAQWNLGATPGTVTASMEQFVDFAPQAPPTPPGGYLPLTPARLLDTRSATPVDAGSVTELVVAGTSDVPADATSAVLNVAVDAPAASGYLTVYPCGTDRPLASSVNFAAGETASNGVTAKIGADGKVCIYSTQVAHLVVDVNGAHVPAGATGMFSAQTPARVLDTRDPVATMTAGETRELLLAGEHGVPADATAVVLNVTATNAAADGFVTVFPCGADRPLASTLNFAAGETTANAVVAKIGADGKVCLYSFVATDVVVDVDGSFGPAGTAMYGELVPGRLLDTRDGTKPAMGSVTEVVVAGQAGVPEGAASVVLNVTADAPAAAGFVTAYPCGVERPLASNLNFAAGQTVANSVTVAVGDDGKVCLYASEETHLVVDVSGAFSVPVG